MLQSKSKLLVSKLRLLISQDTVHYGPCFTKLYTVVSKPVIHKVNNVPVSYQYELHRFIVHIDVTIVEIWLHKSPFIHILRGINIIHYESVYVGP